MYISPLFTLPNPQMQYGSPECSFNENDKYANTQKYKYYPNNSIIQHFQQTNEKSHLPVIYNTILHCMYSELRGSVKNIY